MPVTISSVFIVAACVTFQALPTAIAIHAPTLPTENDGIRAAEDLIRRILPRHADHFVVSRAEKGSPGHAACFTIDASGDKVHISGTSGQRALIHLIPGVTSQLESGKAYVSSNLENSRQCVSCAAGVEIAAGFHRFLQEFCHSSISWESTGGNHIDTTCLDTGIAVSRLHSNGPVHKERSAPWHYYQNVVTVR